MAVYFVDTSFWVALLNKRDADHVLAIRWHKHMIRTSSRLTTHAVLWETANIFAYRSARVQAAAIYRGAWHDPSIEVIDFAPDWNQAAIARYESRPDKHWSLTDCLSFVVRESRAVTQALTADHHFVQAGFEALLTKEPPAN